MKNLQKGTSSALPVLKVDRNVNMPAIILKKPKKGKSKHKKKEGKMYSASSVAANKSCWKFQM